MISVAPNTPRLTRLHLARFVLFTAVALAAVPAARAQQPDFKLVAVQAAHAVEESMASSVVVLDFVGPDTYVSVLGRNMADQFSTSLASAGGKFVVVDRAKMRQAVESNHFAPEIIAEPEMATWLAKSIGAMAAISGRLSLDGSSVQLTIDCFRVKDGKISGSFRVTYPLTDEWKTLSAKNIDPDADVASTDKSNTPTCRNCPRPDYTQAALDEKYQGRAVILAVIGKDGLARDFKVEKGLRDGLTLASVQAVQKWKFNPAKGPDGEPIDVRVPIEVMFRVYH